MSGPNWPQLWEKIITLSSEFGLQLVTALVIFWVGRVIAKTAQNTLHRILQSQQVDKILETFVCNLAYWAIMIFVIIAAVHQIGVQTTSLVAMLGAAGLAVGLALQGSLSNFAAGVLIVVFRPYRVGDWIEAAGISGSVEQVQILTTILITADNKQIIVPNSQIMNSVITNYSAKKTRRIDMTIAVSYKDDLDKVRKTIEDLIKNESRILKDPNYLIAVSELADSSVNFMVRVWVKTQDYANVKFDMTEAVKKRFDQEGISFPFPQQDIHIYRQP
ncbi:MAG: mechanosensitive ion channel protein [Woeseia sp.]|nr:mechanosensitive ion channel protein [Woeseia sp.]